jgi:hypothetical protein
MDEADRPAVVPPAFSEESCVRIAYLQAVIGNIYNHLSVTQAMDSLNSTLDTLLVVGALPAYPRPVQTLASAKQHLGLDTDQYITQYVLCPICWKHYTPKEVDKLQGPVCAVQHCNGIIYEEYVDSKGRNKQRPFKVNPHTSIIQTLRQFFMRPGFANLIKDSQNHQGGHNRDKNFVMRDMDNAEGWDQVYTNTICEVGII